MSKVKLKEIKKFIKKLNKADLLEDEIEISKDVNEMKEAFFDGMEEIDSDGNLDEVPDDVFDYYEKISGGDVEEDDDGENGEGDDGGLREELEEMTKKELKAYIKKNKLGIDVKGKKQAFIDAILEAVEGDGNEDDDEDDDDDGDLREELEEMTKKELRAYVKKNKLDVEVKGKKASIIDAILEAVEEDEEEEKPTKKKRGKKGKKAKEDGYNVERVKELLEEALELLNG